MDSTATVSSFKLMLEDMTFPQDARPTLMAHEETLRLNYPPLMLANYSLVPLPPQDLVFGNVAAPCDVHILNWRKSTFTDGYFALLLQRLAASCTTKCTRDPDEISFVNVARLFSNRVLGTLDKRMTPTSLSLLHDQKRVRLNDPVHLPEPELTAIKLHPRKQ